MRSDFQSYFDHRYLMKPWGENSILFTAEFQALGGDLHWERAQTALEAYYHRDGGFFHFDDKEGWSHDNMTGAMCLSALMGFSYHRRMYAKNWRSYLHPRDFFFHLWLAYPRVGRLFLWVSSLIMIVAALFPHHKNIDGREVLATDGLLLSFLRTRATAMPLTRRLLDKVIGRRGGWHHIFRTYFPDPRHPNHILSKSL